MKTIRKLVLLSLISTLVSGTGSLLNAAESSSEPQTALSTAPGLMATVVSVDQAKQKLTVKIKDRLYVFRLSSQTAVNLNGKLASLDSMVPGQNVELVARRRADGNFEIVAIRIQPGTGSGVVPTGGALAYKKGKKGTREPVLPDEIAIMVTPLRTEPNPANTSGPIVSPEN